MKSGCCYLGFFACSHVDPAIFPNSACPLGSLCTPVYLRPSPRVQCYPGESVTYQWLANCVSRVQSMHAVFPREVQPHDELLKEPF